MNCLVHSSWGRRDRKRVVWRWMGSGTRAGFTLLELMVVIAVVSVLAALLLPALSAAKAKAGAIVCASNQRQWGLALALYLDDHRETVPFFADRMESTQVFWFQRLAPYLVMPADEGLEFNRATIYDSKLRRCPGGRAGSPPYCQVAREDCARWNCYVGVHFGRGNNRECALSGPFYYGEFAAGPNAALKVGSIDRPADALFFLDTMTHYAYSLADPAFRPGLDVNGDGAVDTCADAMAEQSPFNAARPTVHNGGCNVTLLDGHVERLALSVLWKVDPRGQPLHSFWYLAD